MKKHHKKKSYGEALYSKGGSVFGEGFKKKVKRMGL